MTLKFEYIIILTLSFFNVAYADNITGKKKEEIQSELNKQCEVARENKLKPLREDLITECLTGQRNPEDYCTNFYSTYGDAAVHANGHVQPRMFKSLQL